MKWRTKKYVGKTNVIETSDIRQKLGSYILMISHIIERKLTNTSEWKYLLHMSDRSKGNWGTKCFISWLFFVGYIINVRPLLNATNFAANNQVKDSLHVLQAKPSHFGSNNPNVITQQQQKISSLRSAEQNGYKISIFKRSCLAFHPSFCIWVCKCCKMKTEETIEFLFWLLLSHIFIKKCLTARVG